MPGLVDDLATLDTATLEALLHRRPDLLVPPEPRDLTELAELMELPGSLATAVVVSPRPDLQVVEALQALGGRASEASLRRLLGVPEGAGDDPLAGPLGRLAEAFVVRREGSGPRGAELVAAAGIADLFPTPLGLQAPLSRLLPQLPAAILQRALRAHGEPRPSRKADCVEALHRVLSDADRVRAVVATAPPRLQAWLELHLSGLHDDEDELAHTYDPQAWALERQALEWAQEKGLVLSLGWSGVVDVPAEVGLALRGAGWSAPFEPAPPTPPPSAAVDPSAVAREAAASATAAAGLVTAAADVVRTDGVPLLRAGGVGARELSRLAKRLGTAEREVRLALGLLDAAGLLALGDGRIEAAPDLTPWRDAEPAEQYATVVRAWWEDHRVPTRTRRVDGGALPALVDTGGVPAAAARAGLLRLLADVPEGKAVPLPEAADLLRWVAPLLDDPDDEELVPATWAEAGLLGAVALDALTPLGRALVAGDDEALRRVAREVLPGTEDRALVGPDLTAVVPGTPSARVTTLLDSCADREGRGGAVVWRITPGSVRRALDSGAAASELRDELADVAGGTLPQVLEQLLADVARRHGSLRVRPAVGVVHGEDPALLAQAALDRSLRSLGLAHVAPTVLTSTADVATTVSALRAAGYLPMPEDESGAVVLPVRARTSEPRRSRRPRDEAPAPQASAASEVVDVAALAAQLHAAGAGDPTTLASEREVLLQSRAPQLGRAEVRRLAVAVDEGLAVEVDYRSSSGRVTTRTLSDLSDHGSTLTAWCHLREGERHFSLGRVLAVRPGNLEDR